MQRILNTKKQFLFAWLLHLSHQLKVHCRPNQSQSSTYTQAHKMEVKLMAGVVINGFLEKFFQHQYLLLEDKVCKYLFKKVLPLCSRTSALCTKPSLSRNTFITRLLGQTLGSWSFSFNRTRSIFFKFLSSMSHLWCFCNN